MTDGEEIKILTRKLKQGDLEKLTLGELVERIILGENALFQYQFVQRKDSLDSPDAASLISASRDGLRKFYQEINRREQSYLSRD